MKSIIIALVSSAVFTAVANAEDLGNLTNTVTVSATVDYKGEEVTVSYDAGCVAKGDALAPYPTVYGARVSETEGVMIKTPNFCSPESNTFVQFFYIPSTTDLDFMIGHMADDAVDENVSPLTLKGVQLTPYAGDASPELHLGILPGDFLAVNKMNMRPPANQFSCYSVQKAAIPDEMKAAVSTDVNYRPGELWLHSGEDHEYLAVRLRDLLVFGDQAVATEHVGAIKIAPKSTSELDYALDMTEGMGKSFAYCQRNDYMLMNESEISGSKRLPKTKNFYVNGQYLGTAEDAVSFNVIDGSYLFYGDEWQYRVSVSGF